MDSMYWYSFDHECCCVKNKTESTCHSRALRVASVASIMGTDRMQTLPPSLTSLKLPCSELIHQTFFPFCNQQQQHYGICSIQQNVIIGPRTSVNYSCRCLHETFLKDSHHLTPSSDN